MKTLSNLILLALFLSACAIPAPYFNTQAQPVTVPTYSLPSPGAAPVPPIGWKEYVTKGTINIRSEPSTSSPTVGYLLPGVKVKADCDREDNFCQVVGGYVLEACLGEGQGKCQSK